MSAQSKKRVGLLPYPAVSAGVEATRVAIAGLRTNGIRYGVADALTDEDLLTLGAAATDHRLVTGGSGLALGLPANFRRRGLLGEPWPADLPATKGPALVLAGSCSQATRGQVAHAREVWPNLRLDVDRLAAGEPVVADAVAWAQAQNPDLPVLVYASADPEEVAATQARHGRERAGALVESAFGSIARGLVEAGWRQLVVAGGETSGAVVSALGVRALRIGPEIDPGVPWTETLDAPHLALALKSGNFGTRDFFVKALEMLNRSG
jgi:uncharacterized protein YgbK (DUF1537 family)